MSPQSHIYDNQPNNFDLLRADLGRFWLVWIAAYIGIVIASGVILLRWLNGGEL